MIGSREERPLIVSTVVGDAALAMLEGVVVDVAHVVDEHRLATHQLHHPQSDRPGDEVVPDPRRDRDSLCCGKPCRNLARGLGTERAGRRADRQREQLDDRACGLLHLVRLGCRDHARDPDPAREEDRQRSGEVVVERVDPAELRAPRSCEQDEPVHDDGTVTTRLASLVASRADRRWSSCGATYMDGLCDTRPGSG